MNIIKKVFAGTAAILLSSSLFAGTALADKPSDTGFSDAGYNNQANIFNGTGLSWCLDKVGDPAWCASYLGLYANDNLIMKWNDEWNRGNTENWANGPYKAWLSNEWNGMNGGSGSNWHYKFVWVGDYSANPDLIPASGYGIWGQFAVIMDQGVDPSYGPGHFWFSLAKPAGYGSYPQP